MVKQGHQCTVDTFMTLICVNDAIYRSDIFQVSDPCHTVYLTDAVKQETSQIRSHDFIDFTQQPSQNVIYSVKHEDQKPVLSPVREDPVKLQSILNSKIKIQPKPDTGTHSKTVPSSTTVLTSSSSPSLACSSGECAENSEASSEPWSVRI